MRRVLCGNRTKSFAFDFPLRNIVRRFLGKLRLARRARWTLVKRPQHIDCFGKVLRRGWIKIYLTIEPESQTDITQVQRQMQHVFIAIDGMRMVPQNVIPKRAMV